MLNAMIQLGLQLGLYVQVRDNAGKPTAVKVCKLLSEDPGRYKDAPREGIRRLLEEFMSVKAPREQPVDTSRIAAIRMGTTVRTSCAAVPLRCSEECFQEPREQPVDTSRIAAICMGC